mmetsp:Transcript_11772/g.25501  ORF Transcript_11772/g.25501 Transcript_11772/m.25501 type:complete len:1291 (+) Transcript_11772:205-4077(+)
MEKISSTPNGAPVLAGESETVARAPNRSDGVAPAENAAVDANAASTSSTQSNGGGDGAPVPTTSSPTRSVGFREKQSSSPTSLDANDGHPQVSTMRSLPAMSLDTDEKPLIITREREILFAEGRGKNRSSGSSKKKRDTLQTRLSAGSSEDCGETEDECASNNHQARSAKPSNKSSSNPGADRKRSTDTGDNGSSARRVGVSFGAGPPSGGRPPVKRDEKEDEGEIAAQSAEQDSVTGTSEAKTDVSGRGRSGKKAGFEKEPAATVSRTRRPQISFGGDGIVADGGGGNAKIAKPRRKRDPTPFVSRSAAGIDDDDDDDDDDDEDEDAEDASSEVDKAGAHGDSSSEQNEMGKEDPVVISVKPDSGSGDPVGIYRGNGGGGDGMGKRTITFGRNQVKEFESEMEALSRQTTLKSAFSRETSIVFDGEKELQIFEKEISPSVEIENDVLSAVPHQTISAASMSPYIPKVVGTADQARKVNFAGGAVPDDGGDGRGRNGPKKGRRKRDPTPFVSRSFLPPDDDDEDDEAASDSARIASTSSSASEHVQFMEPSGDEIRDSRRVSQRVGFRSVRKRDPTPFIPRSSIPVDDDDDDDYSAQDEPRTAPKTDMKAVPISRDDDHVHFTEPTAQERESARKASGRVGVRSFRKRDPTPFVRRSFVPEEDDDSDASIDDNLADLPEAPSEPSPFSPVPQMPVIVPTAANLRPFQKAPTSQVEVGAFHSSAPQDDRAARRRMGAADLLRVSDGVRTAFPNVDPLMCDVSCFAQLDHVYLLVADLRVAAAFYVDALGLTPDPHMPTSCFGRALWLNHGRQQLRLMLSPESQVISGGFSFIVDDLASARIRLRRAAPLFSDLSAFIVDVSDDNAISVTCPWGNTICLREMKRAQTGVPASGETMSAGIESISWVLRPGQSMAVADFYHNTIGAVVAMEQRSGKMSVRLGPGQSLVFSETSAVIGNTSPLVLCVYVSEFSSLYSIVRDAGMLLDVNEAKNEFVFQHTIASDVVFVFKIRSLMHPSFSHSRAFAGCSMSTIGFSERELGFGDNLADLNLQRSAYSAPVPRQAQPAGPVSVLKKREQPAFGDIQGNSGLVFGGGGAEQDDAGGRKGISFGHVQVKEFTMDDSRSNAGSSCSASRTSSRASSLIFTRGEYPETSDSHDAEQAFNPKPDQGDTSSARSSLANDVSASASVDDSRGRSGRGGVIESNAVIGGSVASASASSSTISSAPIVSEHVHFNEPSAEERGEVRRESLRVGIRSVRRRDPTPFVPRSFRPTDEDEDDEDHGYPGGSHERGRR